MNSILTQIKQALFNHSVSAYRSLLTVEKTKKISQHYTPPRRSMTVGRLVLESSAATGCSQIIPLKKGKNTIQISKGARASYWNLDSDSLPPKLTESNVYELTTSGVNVEFKDGANQSTLLHNDRIRFPETVGHVRLTSRWITRPNPSLVILAFLMTKTLLASNVAFASNAMQKKLHFLDSNYSGQSSETINTSFSYLGPNPIDKGFLKVFANLKSGTEHSLDLISISSPRTLSIILVDNSALCVHQGAEQVIEKNLQNLLSLRGQDSFATVHLLTESTPTLSLKRNLSVKQLNILCDQSVMSQDPFKLFDKTHKSLIPSKKFLSKNNIENIELITIGGASLSPSSQSLDVLKSFNIRLTKVFYSEIHFLTAQTTSSEGSNVTTQAVFLSPEEAFVAWPQYYAAQVKNSFPAQTKKEAALRLNIQYTDASKTLHQDTRIISAKINSNITWWDQNKVSVFIAAIIAFLISVSALVYYYFKPRRCPKTGNIRSRHWKGNLWNPEKGNAVLYIEDVDKNFIGAHTVSSFPFKIGHKHANVKLKHLPKTLRPLSLSKLGDSLFNLHNPNNEFQTYSNGNMNTGSHFIKNKEIIEFGIYRLHFWFV